MEKVVFKLGLRVESEWSEDDVPSIRGKFYSLRNKYVYKFPTGEIKKNYVNVKINVKPLRSKSGEEKENIKFCYSTSVGISLIHQEKIVSEQVLIFLMN